ncbi:DUF2878 domain-containing protein [Wenzhouxiangella sp. AB-CW3]|uniref:DUF2878 domain-containing protein n=1 Tax=Wenzhouxiangella sp. AB-CW3 TaxID=2771012 RepID=UPI00168B28A4|nr:DUF2878 domain-containing protein [Wenzhouxiangella sp. AB-CW3]QOC23344.1 DUF2878 domain-containing protein [Wenzhouxiangella sp. AB-CW3]
MMTRDFLVNQGLFQIAWPACVIGAAQGVGWIGGMVVGSLALWQLQTVRRHPRDWQIIIICLVTGLLLDTAWIRLGLLEYSMAWPSAEFAPAWILLLWLALALVINHSMALFKRRLALIAVLGAVGSPLSYFAGARFGAVEWVAPAWQVVVATGLSWALILPALFWLAGPPSARSQSPRVTYNGDLHEDH